MTKSRCTLFKVVCYHLVGDSRSVCWSFNIITLLPPLAQTQAQACDSNMGPQYSNSFKKHHNCKFTYKKCHINLVHQNIMSTQTIVFRWYYYDFIVAKYLTVTFISISAWLLMIVDAPEWYANPIAPSQK